MLAIAHRGASGHEPENTLRSVAYAIALGTDWIEIDVQFVDGELILLHDDTLDRTTNGSGIAAEQSFDYLRTLNAGKGEKIPTLIEVMDLIGARVGLNIELKGGGVVDPVATLVSDYQDRRPAWHGRIMLSSFDQSQIAELAAHERDFRLGLAFEDDAESALTRAGDLNAYSINPSMAQVTAELVAEAHAAGMKVFVFTVNEPEDIVAMQKLDVDGVFSDYPDRVIALR
ncbi:MAG TPA: glycerophosphodiester phosphodiesterase family protein [Gammaproteobacteria bacterium]